VGTLFSEKNKVSTNNTQQHARQETFRTALRGTVAKSDMKRLAQLAPLTVTVGGVSPSKTRLWWLAFFDSSHRGDCHDSKTLTAVKPQIDRIYDVITHLIGIHI